MTAKQGLLLVNLGTPAAPTASAVRRYLAEFLADRRVIEIPRLLWLPLLYGVILPLRCKRVARNYASIWLDEGSPLAVYTRRQAQALQQKLEIPVEPAFRYGEPSIAHALAKLERAGCDDIILLPMYPQFSATTSATVFDAVAAYYAKRRSMPGLQWINAYQTHPDYIQALAASVRKHWQDKGRSEKLLMSFHGLPQVNVDRGDPYQAHCQATAQALAQTLDLADGAWGLAFQSRFGKQVWLQPYTEPLLCQWAGEGLKTVDVICPGFPADCLETLEEIRLGAAATFRQAGGQSLNYIPALNDNPAHIDALAALVRPRLNSCNPQTLPHD